jgi:hypothetical protein
MVDMRQLDYVLFDLDCGKNNGGAKQAEVHSTR